MTMNVVDLLEMIDIAKRDAQRLALFQRPDSRLTQGAFICAAIRKTREMILFGRLARMLTVRLEQFGVFLVFAHLSIYRTAIVDHGQRGRHELTYYRPSLFRQRQIFPLPLQGIP